MKALVIGPGGREHALGWKLAQSSHLSAMWCVDIVAEDLPRLLAFAEHKETDLTVVGPDNPLALGIVDLFEEEGLRIWGPNRSAARFESSKVFAQQFMERYG